MFVSLIVAGMCVCERWICIPGVPGYGKSSCDMPGSGIMVRLLERKKAMYSANVLSMEMFS